MVIKHFIYLVSLLAMLALSCTRVHKEQARQAEHFIGRTISELKSELGQPVNSERLSDGRERLHFLDPIVVRTSASNNSAALRIVAWDIVLDKEKVVDASAVYGIDYPRNGVGTKFALVAQFMAITEEAEAGAERIPFVTTDGKDYFLSPSAALCAVSIESLRIQIEPSDPPIIRLVGRVAAPGADSIRSFSSQSGGQYALFAINNEPIATIRILNELPSGAEFEVRFPATIEARSALSKVGVVLPTNN